mgnify:CR=1 FL=1
MPFPEIIFQTNLGIILLSIINVFGIWMCIFVLSGKIDKRLNYLFVISLIFTLGWINLASSINIVEVSDPTFLFKIFYSIIIFSYLSYYIFFKFIYDINAKFDLLDKIVIPTFTIFAFIALDTDFLIKGYDVTSWGFNPVFGPLRSVFFISSLIFSSIIMFVASYKYFKLSESEKLRFSYSLVGIIGFGFTNVILNVLIPFLTKDYKYSFIADYISPVFFLFIALSVAYKKLVDIKLSLSFLLISAIAFVMVLDIIFFQSYNFYIFAVKLVGLILIFVIGYFLVENIILENKKRNELKDILLKLKEVNKKLTQSYKKLKEIDKAKSEFVSITSHQLRTPLSAITGYLSLIKDGTYGIMPENLREPIDNIEEMSKRLSLLVGNLLNISRIEAGRIEFQPKEINISEIIKKVTNEMKVNIEKKGLYLKLHLPEEDIYIQADEEKIINIITNLIDNAIKYTDKGGIDVYLEEKNGNKILIKVKDTGIGIGKEDLRKVFALFERGKRALKKHTEGYGIGMYVVSQFVKLHQGRVWFESEGENKGSTFYVELPKEVEKRKEK